MYITRFGKSECFCGQTTGENEARSSLAFMAGKRWLENFVSQTQNPLSPDRPTAKISSPPPSKNNGLPISYNEV
jgi:hypothetical protein